MPLASPVRDLRLVALPVLSLLLGLCLIGGVLSYTVLTWHHRAAIESEHGASVAALAEARTNEAVGTVTTALHMMASPTAWQGDGATGLTRAVQAGGRIGSVSLVGRDGRILFSTVPRNLGLSLAPNEYGGGWTTARFGVGTLFAGRDLFDRRSPGPAAPAHFAVVSVPASDGDGFALATVSLRALQVGISAFLTGADAHSLGLYWRDGALLHGVGPIALPATLPPEVLRAVAETDAYTSADAGIRLADTSQFTCRASPSNPFIVCSRLTLGSILREWQDWRGAALVVLILTVGALVTAMTRIAIDQRRRARERERLRVDIVRSERRQRVALESATGIVWEWDPARDVIRYFGNNARLFGPDAPAAETLEAFLARLRPEDRANFTTTLTGWRESDAPEFSALLQLAPPNARWLRLSGRRDAGADGGLIGTMADVTALFETSERYRAIFREVAQPILLLDEAGIIEEANPATAAAFDTPEASLPGRAVGELVGRTWAAGHTGASLSDIAGGSAALIGLRADGTTFPLSAATGIWVLDGRARSIAVLRDLSAEREIEQRLRAAKRASDEAAQAKSEFLSTMSHEIRTPLNGVIGTAGLLAETRLDPTQARYVTILQDSADHLLQLINDILDLSKLDATRIELELAPFDVAEQVKATLDVLASRAVAKGLALRTHIAPGVPPRLLGDISRIRQILLNLVGNAIKFTPAGSVALEVTCDLDLTGANPVRFAVCDTGIGIPADQLGRLFGNFVQLDGSTARRFGGTGLGLAISNRLAERMGGRITVTSEPGQGSIFCLELPLPAAAAAGVDVADHPSPPVLPGLVILVAEDNPTNQLVARSMLETMGHKVQVVGDGEEAVDAILSRDLDVVLMDVMMPRMDGLAATRAIRAMDKFKALPIVAVTAGAFAHDVEACMAAGMSGFVAKPFNRRALQTALAEAIAWHASHQPQTTATDN